MRIAHFSDLHVGASPAEWDAYEALVERLPALGADALVVTGDLVHVPEDIENLNRVRDLLGLVDVPWFAVPGNHDVATPGVGGAFHALFGPFPRVERVGDTAFLLFDSFGDLPVRGRLGSDLTTINGASWWGDGAISRKQMNTVAAQLRLPDKNRVAILHHHLGPSPDTKVNPLRNAPEFGRFCSENGITHAFVGHWHEPVDPMDIHGVTRLRVGRSTKPPYTIGVLDLADGSFERHEA